MTVTATEIRDYGAQQSGKWDPTEEGQRGVLSPAGRQAAECSRRGTNPDEDKEAEISVADMRDT